MGALKIYPALNGRALKVQAPTFVGEEFVPIGLSSAREGGELLFKARGFSPVVCVLLKEKGTSHD